MARPFVWQVRVYWEDTDGGGVVYHARYLAFLERARTEWLRARGIDQSRLAAEHDLLFAVRRMDIDFRGAARLDDRLEIGVRPVSLGASRMRFEQDLRRVGDESVLLAARVEAACLSASGFHAVRMPPWVRERIADNLEEQ